MSGLGSRASGDSARPPVGVFVLDDQEIVRRGVRGLLEAERTTALTSCLPHPAFMREHPADSAQTGLGRAVLAPRLDQRRRGHAWTVPGRDCARSNGRS